MNISKLKSSYIIEVVLSIFVFVLLVDPADNLTRLKMPLFALLTLLCVIFYPKTSVVETRPLICFIGVCIVTSIIGFLRNTNINIEFAIGIYKGLIMGVIILWASRLKVLEKLYFPSFIIGALVIFLYIASFLFPNIIAIVYPLTISEESPWPIMLSIRSFIGINVVSVFYKTSPLFLFVVAVYLHRWLNHIGNNRLNTLICIVSLSTLLMSGTRMNMLSGLALIGWCVLLKLWKSKRGKIIAIYGGMISIALGVIVVSMLLNDRGESSLEVKTILAQAFYNEVHKDPLMLIFGQGSGATFDSLGVRGQFAVQSELTYYDVIRWFGIPGLALIMMIYVQPLFIIYKKRKRLPYSAEIIVAYVLYLCIAGTNPLLISSTGILALFTLYSYALNPHYEQKNINI